MKAVVLAAGKGTRMKPLTEDTPKPLLPVAGKPVIEHNIDLLEDSVEEIIIVAGYRIEQFRDHFQGRENVRIVEQEEALGTADAALQASEHLDREAVILNGDDIYGEEAVKAVERESALLSAQSTDPAKFGVLEIEEGRIKSIEEKPEEPPTNFVNTGFYVVQPGFFEMLEEVSESERGEYEITEAVEQYIEEYEVEVVETHRWLPCSYPWQLINANEELLETERKIESEVPESSTVKGNARIEENVEIGENCVIEGPALVKEGCKIGPGAYIRKGTVLERDVEVANSEIKNTVVREGSKVPHFSYIGDSYLGKEVNIGAGTKTANLRNDTGNVKMEVKGDLIDTGREKLGAVIASRAKLGVNNSIKPGRKIGFESKTDSGEKIGRNIPSQKVLKDGEIK